MAKAKAIALADAEIPSDNRVVFTEEKLVDGGIKTPYFRFVFNNDETRWTYHIDATDGGIRFTDKENLNKRDI